MFHRTGPLSRSCQELVEILSLFLTVFKDIGLDWTPLRLDWASPADDLNGSVADGRQARIRARIGSGLTAPRLQSFGYGQALA